MIKKILIAISKLPRAYISITAMVVIVAAGGAGAAVVRTIAVQTDDPSSKAESSVGLSDDEQSIAQDAKTEQTKTNKSETKKKSTSIKKSESSNTDSKSPTGSGSTPSTPPSSSPKPSQPAASCPNAAHTPGGSDGTGGCWPYAGNTGVPTGVSLSTYSGPCSIFVDTVIQNKTVNCALQMYDDASLTVRNSVVKGFIENTYTTGAGKLLVEDSEIQAGAWSGGAAWGSSMTIRRSELTGGQHSVHCESNCTVTDSWLHNQYNPDGGSYHNNAFLSNGGTNMHLSGNTLHCTALLNDTDGGCTSNLTLLGDFDTISYVTATSNLMMANNSSIAYCVVGGYAPSKPYPIAHHVVMQNNIFQRGPNKKCGVYGPVTSFQTTASGNVWSGNKWADGATVSP